LVGERTFGKGLVQATRPLPYNSQLKITTAKYYIPSGRCIQAINYSERNKDGSVAKIPDSLRVAFKTKNGRVVYDGGGILPDVKVAPPFLAPISVSLITKGLIFDYAVKYHYEHPQIASARDFKLPDAEYDDFVKWLSDKDYDYTTKVEKTIEDLKKVAKKEKYYEKIKGNIDMLETAVKHNKEKDLKQFKNEIRSLLESRIVETYYLMQGTFESSFDDDVQLKAAIDVLDDPAHYEKLLEIKTN
jgi:carboxyl-terminal processing protease